MRAATQKKIDACHAEIARLVKMEKDYMRRTNPEPNELLQSIADTRIECAAKSPRQRQTSYWATASFPKLGVNNHG